MVTVEAGMTKRLAATAVMGTIVVIALAIVSTPALACGGLVAPNGTVRLLRTSTLAAYHDGVEHYVTSFQFAGEPSDVPAGPGGGGGEFGSIVPLPAVPTSVERGGDWTLQRLAKEVAPRRETVFDGAVASTAKQAAPAEVLQQVRIDALDLTVLKGGGKAVGDWAKEHGFLLTPDAPELLDYYAKQSPIFLAARFDADAARARGQQIGDGTPIHITMPLDHPWVPLRILTLGRGEFEPVDADVFLLTDDEPKLSPGLGSSTGMTLAYSQKASDALLSDLRSDKNSAWVPDHAWLSQVRIDGSASQLNHDLTVTTRPESEIHVVTPTPIAQTGSSHAWVWVLVVVSCLAGPTVVLLAVRALRRSSSASA